MPPKPPKPPKPPRLPGWATELNIFFRQASKLSFEPKEELINFTGDAYLISIMYFYIKWQAGLEPSEYESQKTWKKEAVPLPSQKLFTRTADAIESLMDKAVYTTDDLEKLDILKSEAYKAQIDMRAWESRPQAPPILTWIGYPFSILSLTAKQIGEKGNIKLSDVCKQFLRALIIDSTSFENDKGGPSEPPRRPRNPRGGPQR